MLAEKAMALRYTLQDVPREGDCLFECKASFLNELPDGANHTHVDVRRRIVDWLEKHEEDLVDEADRHSAVRSRYNSDIYRSYQEYLTALKEPGCFGDFLAIHAASQVEN